MTNIDDYAAIAGPAVLDELRLLARHLQGRTIQNINSTAIGGGVAEILSRMLPLMKQLGLQVRWDVIKGDEKFFVITKKIHNALHGVEVTLSDEEVEYFLTVDRDNAAEMTFEEYVVVHDPQPIALVEKRSAAGGKWLWRCHIDFSNPEMRIWKLLKGFVRQFDAAIFSAPAFARRLPITQVLISPSIDPLSDKNKVLPEDAVQSVFDRFGIDRSRPIVTQISRFDFLKDPVGVIRAYTIAKRHVDCQLVLAGGGATDDPEGAAVLEQVREAAGNDKDIFILLLPPASDLDINALQRGSTLVLQKSLREGFGLTVAEALWKGKPVIASAVGGIPLQITHNHGGILTHSIEGTAHWIKQLIREPDHASRLGLNGREHIKQNFLITRHIRDYLLLFVSLLHEGDTVYL
jgi:trehalose synthase